MDYMEKIFNLVDSDEPFLQKLIDDKIKETLHLEYKKEMIDHVKLARKVSAFANSLGGIMIIGIEEKGGLPIKLNPLDPNLGETIENVLITSISRELPFKITAINSTKEKDKKYYVIFVPKSSNGPHMVISEKDFRYYKRAYVRKNFSSVPMSDEEVRESLAKNLKYRDTLISNIKDKRILLFNNETWQTQKNKLIYLRYSSTINDNIDMDSLKPKLRGIGKDVCGDIGQLSSDNVKNFGKSLLFKRDFIDDKNISLRQKMYIQISMEGYIEFVRLGITKESSLYKKVLRDNIVINDLKCYLQFLGVCYQILKYIGEVFIFIELNNIEDSVIFSQSLLNEFSRKSSEPSWEDSNYYQTFEIINKSSEVLKYFADGIFKNYGYENCFKLKSEKT